MGKRIPRGRNEEIFEYYETNRVTKTYKEVCLMFGLSEQRTKAIVREVRTARGIKFVPMGREAKIRRKKEQEVISKVITPFLNLQSAWPGEFQYEPIIIVDKARRISKLGVNL